MLYKINQARLSQSKLINYHFFEYAIEWIIKIETEFIIKRTKGPKEKRTKGQKDKRTKGQKDIKVCLYLVVLPWNMNNTGLFVFGECLTIRINMIDIVF